MLQCKAAGAQKPPFSAEHPDTTAQSTCQGRLGGCNAGSAPRRTTGVRCHVVCTTCLLVEVRSGGVCVGGGD